MQAADVYPNLLNYPAMHTTGTVKRMNYKWNFASEFSRNNVICCYSQNIHPFLLNLWDDVLAESIVFYVCQNRRSQAVPSLWKHVIDVGLPEGILYSVYPMRKSSCYQAISF